MFAAFAATSIAWAAEPAASPVHLKVQGTKTVSGADRDVVEEAVAVELIRAKCAIRLVQNESDARDLELVIDIDRWRESQEPGGAPILGSDGYERPGHVSVVEVRGNILAYRPGEAEPRATKRFERSRKAGTMPVGAWDPLEQARRLVLGTLADDAGKLACKELKALAKDREKAAAAPAR